MPRALVIEFVGSFTPVARLTNSNGHGNTVRSTFLAFAPAGWTCDVGEFDNSAGATRFLNWFSTQANNYDLIICSNIVDIFFQRDMAVLATQYSKPCFFSVQNNPPLTQESSFNKRGYFIYCGVGTTSNLGAASLRLDTFGDPANLTFPNRGFTSFGTPVIAGKAAALVDAGLTWQQINRAVQQQAASYPSWTIQNGFGAAPASYSAPSSYDRFPPQSSGMWRNSGNVLNIYFTALPGENPTALRVYRNGVLDGTYAANTWLTSENDTTLPIIPHYRVNHLVVSDGGTFTFNLAFQYASGESQIFAYNEATVSGFTDNFDPPPDPPPPEPPPPEPEPQPPIIPPFMPVPLLSLNAQPGSIKYGDWGNVPKFRLGDWAELT